MVKTLLANAEATGDASPLPELGRSPGEGNGNPVQYSCLENPMDRGACQAAVYEVTKSDMTEHAGTQKGAQRVSLSCTSQHQIVSLGSDVGKLICPEPVLSVTAH